MRALIVDDDSTSRLLLQRLLGDFGPTHVAVNGKEAVDAVRLALASGEPYELICMDIMMPQMDGQEALRQIRRLEEDMGILASKGAKILMTTALSDLTSVATAYGSLCTGYLVKPIEGARLMAELRNLKLVA